MEITGGACRAKGGKDKFISLDVVVFGGGDSAVVIQMVAGEAVEAGGFRWLRRLAKEGGVAVLRFGGDGEGRSGGLSDGRMVGCRDAVCGRGGARLGFGFRAVAVECGVFVSSVGFGIFVRLVEVVCAVTIGVRRATNAKRGCLAIQL